MEKTIVLRNESDLRGLSYYTLCKLSDVTHRHTLAGILDAATTRFRGELTTDALGNFLSLR